MGSKFKVGDIVVMSDGGFGPRYNGKLGIVDQILEQDGLRYRLDYYIIPLDEQDDSAMLYFEDELKTSEIADNKIARKLYPDWEPTEDGKLRPKNV